MSLPAFAGYWSRSTFSKPESRTCFSTQLGPLCQSEQQHNRGVFEGVCFGVFVSARHDYCNKYLRLVVAEDSHKITSLKIQINREKGKKQRQAATWNNKSRSNNTMVKLAINCSRVCGCCCIAYLYSRYSIT